MKKTIDNIRLNEEVGNVRIDKLEPNSAYTGGWLIYVTCLECGTKLGMSFVTLNKRIEKGTSGCKVCTATVFKKGDISMDWVNSMWKVPENVIGTKVYCEFPMK